MSELKKSSSHEQQEAGHIIFNLVEEWLGIELEETPKIYLADTHMEPDFFSEKAGVVGEIFSHIGKPKKAQDNKISNDILKMLLLDKLHNKNYRKIIVVCDDAELKQLTGKSLVAESIRQFNIEIKKFDLSDEVRNRIIEAQNRQVMVNK